MEFGHLNILGYLAGFFTTLAFLPQVVKCWKTKKTKDVSFLMFLIFVLGVFLWLIYGFLTHNLPIIIANLITFVLSLSILIAKLKYG